MGLNVVKDRLNDVSYVQLSNKMERGYVVTSHVLI